MKKNFLFFTLLTFSSIAFGQEKLIPKKVGFLYNFGNENNFMFDDEDYFYTTRTFKAQAFYDLFEYKFINFSLLVQPQIQAIKHQLLNEQFVIPTEENYLAKRARYTALKTIHLYAMEFGFSAKFQLFNPLSFDITTSLGFAYIDETTERLAEGFTFIENLSVGFTVNTSTKTKVYLGGNIGHISNFDFQSPNNGYNIVGFELGFQYEIK